VRERSSGLDEVMLRVERGEGKSGEDGEEEDLKDLAFGEGAGEGVGDYIEEKVDGAEVLALGGVLRYGFDVERGRIYVHAAAGLDDVGDDQADTERERGDDFEVEERLDANAAELAEVAYARDANDNGEEDDRGDHHPDEFDEAVAEWLEEVGGVRPHEANDHSGNDSYENAKVESTDEAVRFCFGW
jgi:hypothetical protein